VANVLQKSVSLVDGIESVEQKIDPPHAAHKRVSPKMKTQKLIDAHKDAVAQQDAVLVKMDDSLTRLGVLAKEMGAEISVQDQILIKVDREIDTAQAKTTTVLGRVNKLINSVSKERQCMIIAGLVVILVICIVVAVTL